MELSNVRARINEMMKEKGLRRPSSDLSTTTANVIVSAVTGQQQQQQQLATCFENVSSTTTTTTATTTNNNSLSNCKFVSNDWCFVDCKFLYLNIFFLFVNFKLSSFIE